MNPRGLVYKSLLKTPQGLHLQKKEDHSVGKYQIKRNSKLNNQ